MEVIPKPQSFPENLKSEQQQLVQLMEVDQSAVSDSAKVVVEVELEKTEEQSAVFDSANASNVDSVNDKIAVLDSDMASKISSQADSGTGSPTTDLPGRGDGNCRIQTTSQNRMEGPRQSGQIRKEEADHRHSKRRGSRRLAGSITTFERTRRRLN